VPLADRHVRFFYRADGDWSVQCQKAYSYYQREYRWQNKQVGKAPILHNCGW
jgi:hypothetical protein